MITGNILYNIKVLVIKNGILYFLTAVIAIGLKYHYSRAGSDDLVWILGPTTSLVECLSGIQFEREAHTGFISQGYGIIIAPSCAGINFLITVFCMAVFSSIHVIKHFKPKLLWLAANLACAYLLTVTVNTVRIIVSIYSYNADIYLGWFTPPRVHRLEGIVIYFFFLCLFYMIIIRVVHDIQQGDLKKPRTAISDYRTGNDYFRWVCSSLIPFFWYALVTLGVPLFNGALQENLSRFKEHGWTVLWASFAVLAVIFLTQMVWRRIGRILANNENPLGGFKP